MLVEALLLLALLLAYLVARDRKPKGMAPGPFEFPFIGNKPALKVKEFFTLREKYGDVVTTRLGSFRSVLLYDYRTAREVMAHPDFAGRPGVFDAFSLDDQNKGGVLFTNGEQWQHDRRFVLKNLRNLGMGKTFLETAIHIEAEALINDLKLYNGKPIKYPHSLRTVSLNIIWQMVSGKRYDLRSQEVTAIYDATTRFREEMGISGFIFMFFPGLDKITPRFIKSKLVKANLIDKLLNEMKKLIDVELDEQEKKFIVNEVESSTLISEYLKAMKESDDDRHFSRGALSQIVHDLFGAGSDTVSNMLRWVVYLMAKFPDVTERLQKAIDEIVPKGQLVSLHDKPRLALVEAYAAEALRFCSLIPINVQREALRDTSIAGHFVPKGTHVIAVNAYIHHDTRFWNQPELFSPERFITSEGRFQAPKEGFFAFGSGKRQCVGESLARMELFLFTAALLQNFTIRVPEGQTIQDEFDDQMGIHAPRDQEFEYHFRE